MYWEFREKKVRRKSERRRKDVFVPVDGLDWMVDDWPLFVSIFPPQG